MTLAYVDMATVIDVQVIIHIGIKILIYTHLFILYQVFNNQIFLNFH